MKKVFLIFILISSPLFATTAKTSKELDTFLKNNPNVDLYLLLTNFESKTSTKNLQTSTLNKKIHQLKGIAKLSKEKILPLVKKYSSTYKFYWVNNSLHVKVKSSDANKIIQSKYVKSAYLNTSSLLKIVSTEKLNKTSKSIEWGVNKIRAPQVWAQGIKGQGVIIAGQDTGYQWTHPSIIDNYLGWNGVTVNHNYTWHDAINNPANTCLENQRPVSCDDYGHGTHTMGTILGDDGIGNQIGVAPDAKWMGCRNMDFGNGTPATYTECFQFFLEPTDLNGNNPDSNKTPHIINNSWGCTFSEGCSQPNMLKAVVENVVDAGILVVSSAGNSGPGCNSVNTPTAIYNKALTIGSTTITDEISGFSSRGAVTVDGSNRIKPDVSAPGSNIRSADINGGYINFSGTSMAAPHVVGVAALMISANPQLARKPKIIKHVMLRTSIARAPNDNCTNSATLQPNNTYGWGRIDALNAVNQFKDIIYLDNFEEF